MDKLRGKALALEGIRLTREINRLVLEIEQIIALARHKMNSSYYMRKENNYPWQR